MQPMRSALKMTWRTGITVVLAFILGSCAYTVERKWAYTFNTSKPPHQSFEARQAEAGEAEKHFPDTLRECVAKSSFRPPIRGPSLGSLHWLAQIDWLVRAT